MRKLLLLSLCLSAINICSYVENVHSSVEYQNEETSPQDFREFLKVKSYLEFGPGFWTEYFLEKANKVISVEFVTPGYGPGLIQHYINLYRNYSNWTPIVYFSAISNDTTWAPYKYLGSEHVHKAASYQCATHQNYAVFDDFYLIELTAFIKGLIKYNKSTVALVNSGLYIRGDLVQLLFDRMPIIFASNSDCRFDGVKDDVYGYSRIVTPDNYQEIHLNDGSGITAWIIKDQARQELIEQLVEYNSRW